MQRSTPPPEIHLNTTCKHVALVMRAGSKATCSCLVYMLDCSWISQWPCSFQAGCVQAFVCVCVCTEGSLLKNKSPAVSWCVSSSYLWQRTLFGQSALVHFLEQLFESVPDSRVVPLLAGQILQLWKATASQNHTQASVKASCLCHKLRHKRIKTRNI